MGYVRGSLISADRSCVVCGRTQGLHRHHIFFGANRRLSDRQGCWCYLCGPHHNLSSKGVHFNRELDLQLKRRCQKAWEETYGDRNDFIRMFGKNYL